MIRAVILENEICLRRSVLRILRRLLEVNQHLQVEFVIVVVLDLHREAIDHESVLLTLICEVKSRHIVEWLLTSKLKHLQDSTLVCLGVKYACLNQLSNELTPGIRGQRQLTSNLHSNVVVVDAWLVLVGLAEQVTTEEFLYLVQIVRAHDLDKSLLLDLPAEQLHEHSPLVMR